ncbi:MAG: hypothetical protein NTW49_08060, partial [Bacteroidia bacterium]|nr:hypothetical protein [Bacteroidia bacterium]
MVVATGGVGPYSGDGLYILSAGTTTITVTDANNCSVDVTIYVSEPSALTAQAYEYMPILCNGGTAEYMVVATGGVGPYSGDGLYTLSAGTTTITVTDANNCSVDVTITVDDPSMLTAQAIEYMPILCNGGIAEYMVVATGGVGPYSGDGLYTLPAGTTIITVTDANNCTVDVTITVTEPAPLNAYGYSGTIECNDTTTWVNIWAYGGTSPYSGTGYFNQNAGTYTYTVFDSNGCMASTTITIGEPDALVATSTATAILCNGDSTEITVNAFGGTAPYYLTGIYTKIAGTYTFTVYDSNGCMANTTITIGEPAALVATSTATPILCNGGTSDVTVDAFGGTAPYYFTGVYTEIAGTYTYTVFDSNGCQASTTIAVSEPALLHANSYSGTIECNGGTTWVNIWAYGGTNSYTGTGYFYQNAGTYTYYVYDSNGCQASTTITIVEPDVLVATSTATAILCHGGSSEITVDAYGGTAPYYNTGVYSRPAGTYSFNVYDSHGCQDATTITVGEPSTLMAQAYEYMPILCNGGTAEYMVVATGGVAPYSGDGMYTLSSGTTVITVTDANNCSVDVTIDVSEPSVLTAQAYEYMPILCNGGTAEYMVVATGGVGPYNGDGFYTLPAGTTVITVTDANNCSVNVTIDVSEPSVLTAQAYEYMAILCNGGTAEYMVVATGGVGPYSGDGLYILSAGTTVITVTDANNCSVDVTIDVSEPSVLTAQAFEYMPILCNGGIAEYMVVATGGV